MTTPIIELLARLAAEHDRDMDAARDERHVMAPVDAGRIRAHLERRYTFDAPRPLADVAEDTLAMLRRWGVDVTHPRYFGLFNPSVPGASVAASAIRAHVNPQLATWTHAAAANEIERHVLRVLARALGYDPDASFATFTSGGQESNLSAILVALTRAFPSHASRGLRSLERDPVLYASIEAHHSLVKAAHAAGLGRDALRVVEVDSETLAMDVGALRAAIRDDRARGCAPFFVVGTAGTTSAGAIDPLNELADLAEEEGLFFHVDAAFGGGALLSNGLRAHLRGIERADSVTWDAHKWLSMPMGAGTWLTRHPELVAPSFSTTSGYMPKARAGTMDPYATSLQWSRRFIGIELFVALAEAGLAGLAARIEHQAAMGVALRDRLARAGFTLLHASPLPVVCFTHPRIEAGDVDASDVVRRLHARGRAWISLVRLPRARGPGSRKAMRACITSYLSEERDLDVLLEELLRALAA